MTENNILRSALWYAKQGFSVIPILSPKADSKGKDESKKPPIAWLPYQTQKATEHEIEQWFSDKPDMRLGIVTGKISNLTVVDCDTPEAVEQIESMLPDNFRVPIAISPRGGRHYYFQHEAQIPNKAGVAAGIDTRSEGGYIIAPPSSGLNGKRYSWLQGCKISDIEVPAINSSLISYILSFLIPRAGASKPSNSGISFEEGKRDESLFHVSNCLVKGGMPDIEIRQVLESLIISWGESPDQKWIDTKVESALKRKNTRDRSIAQDVRDWILTSSGFFLTSECFKELDLTSRDFKKAGTLALLRLEKEGLIEKYGGKRGQYRKIESEVIIQEWWKEEATPLDLHWPLKLEKFVKIFPQNIILIEGQKSQGKSAFAIEFCRLNHRLFREPIVYQNVEMSRDEIKERFDCYGSLFPIEEARSAIQFIDGRSGGSWDKIQPNALNVVDYLVEYEKPWMLADYIKKIHGKLGEGIALVLVQRDPYKPYPTGGRAVRDFPRCVISLIKHQLKLEDVKSFYRTEWGNPTGLGIKYKHVNYCQFVEDSEWFEVSEEKYKNFS